MRRHCLGLLAVSLLALSALAAELADEPGAFGKRPDYPKTTPKLLEDYKNLPDYAEAMKKVHAKFTGTPGTLAMFGDSITAAREFWSPLKEPGKNMSPQMRKDYDLVRSYMKDECWSWKGKQYGHEGGKASKWILDNADQWLKDLKPEVVVILVGSNDMDLKVAPEQGLKDWEQNLTDSVKKCLDNGSIVILCTIPPRASRRCDVYNERVLKLAATLKLPVTDYAGQILTRRPDDWDGSAPQFREKYEKTEVPTLISGDGEHPSCPKAFANDYSEEALKTHGYGLRTYLTLTTYAQVLRKVIGVREPPASSQPVVTSQPATAPAAGKP
jgi:hypothetical protein